jgi:hypothetical protein
LYIPSQTGEFTWSKIFLKKKILGSVPQLAIERLTSEFKGKYESCILRYWLLLKRLLLPWLLLAWLLLKRLLLPSHGCFSSGSSSRDCRF